MDVGATCYNAKIYGIWAWKEEFMAEQVLYYYMDNDNILKCGALWDERGGKG